MSDNNVIDLIENLKSLNDKSVKKLTLPESKMKVELKNLLSKHISKINSSLLSSMGQNVKRTLFNKIIEGIFEDVLRLPDGKGYSDFSIFDYYYLLFKIRESINPILTIRDEELEANVKVDITEKINDYTKTKFKLESGKIGKRGCEVYLKVPSYRLMRRFEDITQERQIAEEKKGEKNFDMEQVMKDMFSFSIIPYIYKIKTIVKDREPIEVVFDELSTSKKVGILDFIPSELYKEIIEGIGELNKPIDDLLKTENPDVKVSLDQTFLVDS